MSEVFHSVARKVLEKEGQELVSGQQAALDEFISFFRQKPERGIFMLRGAAGTGKTFLIRIISAILESQGYKSVLLAPTGRATKVVSRRSRRMAFTIHRFIYSPQENAFGNIRFTLKNNNGPYKTAYIVDEASMVGDHRSEKSPRGLLGDLLKFAWQDEKYRIVLMVGDPYQLPPVGSSVSPALDANYLKEEFGATVKETELFQVLRQEGESGILDWAETVRDSMMNSTTPQLSMSSGPGLQVIDQVYEGIEVVTGSYSSDETDKAVILTYSNRAAVELNKQIRWNLFEPEEPVVPGELLMVVKNNYSVGDKKFPFIANGEIGIVRFTDNHSIEKKYGLNWMDVTIEFTDLKQEPVQVECKIILDLLNDRAAQLSRDQVRHVNESRWGAYEEMTKKERVEAIRKDPYINALQVKYAYAITGHKAQGGQWEQVVIAFEPLYKGMELSDYLRWTYTVITRAESGLYVANCPWLNEEFF